MEAISGRVGTIVKLELYIVLGLLLFVSYDQHAWRSEAHFFSISIPSSGCSTENAGTPFWTPF